MEELHRERIRNYNDWLIDTFKQTRFLNSISEIESTSTITWNLLIKFFYVPSDTTKLSNNKTVNFQSKENLEI